MGFPGAFSAEKAHSDCIREKQSIKLVVFPLICCNFAKVFIGVAVLAAMKRESGANPEQNPLL